MLKICKTIQLRQLDWQINFVNAFATDEDIWSVWYVFFLFFIIRSGDICSYKCMIPVGEASD